MLERVEEARLRFASAADPGARRTAAEQVYGAVDDLTYGTLYTDREALAGRLRPVYGDSDPCVRGWVALAVARLVVPHPLTQSHPILAEALRRGNGVEAVSGLCLRLTEPRDDADPDLVVAIARLAAALRSEQAALTALRVLQGLRLPAAAQAASAPFVAEFLRGGFGVDDALRLLVSWPLEARRPALAEVEKLRSHDDWRIRRVAGGLVEGMTPLRPNPSPLRPESNWDVLVSERPVLAHPSYAPDWKQSRPCGACGGTETGRIFSVDDGGNSWVCQLEEYRCRMCGKCTRYERESG